MLSVEPMRVVICFQIVFFDRLLTDEKLRGQITAEVVICFQIVFFDRLLTERRRSNASRAML